MNKDKETKTVDRPYDPEGDPEVKSETKRRFKVKQVDLKRIFREMILADIEPLLRKRIIKVLILHAILVFLLNVVIIHIGNQIIKIYSGICVTLPYYQRIILSINNYWRNYWPITILFHIAFFVIDSRMCAYFLLKKEAYFKLWARVIGALLIIATLLSLFCLIYGVYVTTTITI